jgi:ATP adenylyltransferase/5',5'''-P-1,P-4-tetraphosphate phosphorylase II/Uma2 family endonuclease
MPGFVPGTLWSLIVERTQQALACGALQPIPTTYTWLEQDGIRFLVRQVNNLQRKIEAKQAQETKAAQLGEVFNPFLPYEADLFVADLSPTHVCLLNKYNVVDHHILIITRHFEHQDTLLTQQDFAALWVTLQEVDGLAFYNGGQVAGSSQRHKHLQLVPLPLVESVRLPIAPLIAAAELTSPVGTVPTMPWLHAIAPLTLDLHLDPQQAGHILLNCYRQLLQAVGLEAGDGVSLTCQSGPYNLLATRQWMMVVPRCQPSFAGMEVNALGLAGAFLVRHAQQLAQLQEVTPLVVLQQVCYPPGVLSMSTSTAQSTPAPFAPAQPEGIVFPSVDLYSDEPQLETYLHLQQMMLLLNCLDWLWKDRTDYFAAGNLTIYHSPRQRKSEDFRGPDFFVVLGTEKRPRKSWVVWEEEGKYPNIIIELLSDSTANTDRALKKQIYQDIFRTPDYFWFDPDTLELKGFHLLDGVYHDLQPNPQGHLWSQQLGLYLGVQEQSLRFFTAEGQLVATPREAAEAAQQRAEAERQRAEAERQRNEKLIAQLRELGVNPDEG